MVVLSIVVSGALHPGGSAAQPLPLPRPPTQVAGPVIDLSLEEAIRRAVRDSEEVKLAQASVDEADTRIAAARAARFPQLNATTAYVRTLQSPIGRGLNLQFPEGDRFNPDPTAPLEQRVTYLEQNVSHGRQTMQFVEKDGRTELVHTSYFTSGKEWRDKLYPKVHEKLVDAFHANMQRLMEKP